VVDALSIRRFMTGDSAPVLARAHPRAEARIMKASMRSRGAKTVKARHRRA
jgi:hypothetical protein